VQGQSGREEAWNQREQEDDRKRTNPRRLEFPTVIHPGNRKYDKITLEKVEEGWEEGRTEDWTRANGSQ
jgi:hypothetical protein